MLKARSLPNTTLYLERCCVFKAQALCDTEREALVLEAQAFRYTEYTRARSKHSKVHDSQMCHSPRQAPRGFSSACGSSVSSSQTSDVSNMSGGFPTTCRQRPIAPRSAPCLCSICVNSMFVSRTLLSIHLCPCHLGPRQSHVVLHVMRSCCRCSGE